MPVLAQMGELVIVSRLTELRVKCHQAFSVPGVYVDNVVIDKRDFAALLAVAEAARGLVLGDPIGQTLPAALAPLLKEVPDAS